MQKDIQKTYRQQQIKRRGKFIRQMYCWKIDSVILNNWIIFVQVKKITEVEYVLVKTISCSAQGATK